MLLVACEFCTDFMDALPNVSVLSIIIYSFFFERWKSEYNPNSMLFILILSPT